ncbi:hypothetical protein [Haloferax sp. DFSO52]|uniref:hypothetical protein n=1 Tax=Haloferax sp. DFSO52 TaxID=3388505 RepID=UPI003A89EA79
MSLPDVPPDLPSIYTGRDDEEYHNDEERRAEIQNFFERENAWGEAYSQWVEETLLTDKEFETAVELGLFRKLDFYWDIESQRVEYEIPEVVDGNYDLSLDVASDIEDELDTFAQIVAETMTEYYIDWEPSDESDSDYRQLFGDQYNAADDVLTDEEEAQQDA